MFSPYKKKLRALGLSLPLRRFAILNGDSMR